MLFINCTPKSTNYVAINSNTMKNKNTETAIFAGGCFWCTEAVYNQLHGILKLEPGYIGGQVLNPTYEQVCSGTTGHAEAVRITFDPDKITYNELLEVFFTTHDPTTLNRQGADEGTQYRSEIFYLDELQKKQAERFIVWLDRARIYPKPVVTKISAATTYYVAEEYHKNYYENNPDQGYCRMVIAPKIEKVKKFYTDKLK